MSIYSQTVGQRRTTRYFNRIKIIINYAQTKSNNNLSMTTYVYHDLCTIFCYVSYSVTTVDLGIIITYLIIQ